MIYKKIMLKDISKEKVGNSSYFEIYLNEKTIELKDKIKMPLIVIPGGAYKMCSYREAEPIALRYASEGFNCFVLHYTCDVSYPLPHLELAVLMKYIKDNAKKFRVEKDKVSLIGFSAGGHLASSFGYLHKEFETKLATKKDYLKPFSVILGYPVTSMYIPTLSATKDVITANKPQLIKKLSVPENIGKDYPPTYIWTTKVDTCVPMIHSKLLNKHLKLNKVPSQLRIFKLGVHGGSLCNHEVYDNDFDFKSISENRKWINESVDFIYNLKNKH